MANSNGRYNDKDLVRLIGRKDREAMRLLYDRYAEYLSAVCGRYIPDENDRKDVLQECFIKIFMSVFTFEYRGEGSLKAWMARITVNESLRFLKKAQLTALSNMATPFLIRLRNLKLRMFPTTLSTK